jgi:hypothetical protein
MKILSFEMGHRLLKMLLLVTEWSNCFTCKRYFFTEAVNLIPGLLMMCDAELGNRERYEEVEDLMACSCSDCDGSSSVYEGKWQYFVTVRLLLHQESLDMPCRTYVCQYFGISFLR